MKKRAIGFILILFTLLSVPVSQGGEKPLNTGEMYDFSMELYHRGRCQEAIGGFSEIIRSYPNSRLISYCQYMIGLCYLKMEKYEEALEQFNGYLRMYPDGDRVKEAGKGLQISEEKMKEKLLPQSSPPALPAQSRQTAIEEPKRAEVKLGSQEPKESVKMPFREVKKVKRRICVQIFHFDEKSLEEVEQKIKRLKSSGVDTVIVRVFQGKGDQIYKFVSPGHEEGVYFNTQYAPVVNDVLGKLAEITHRNGLDIFAWITTRYANYGPEGKPDQRCKSYNFETKKIEAAKGFNLFHPDVIKRLEGLFRDLGRYPIDGILFQDDLILRHNEDFSLEANKAFFKEFGYMPHPDLFYIDPYKSDSGKYYVKAYTDQFWSWANWKNRWLMDLAKRLMDAARESNPTLQFGINLYFETILNNSNAAAWFSQTLSAALEKDFDYYAVMAYHRQTTKEWGMEEKKAIALMAEVAQKAVRAVGDPSRVLMKVQIFDWKSYEVIRKKEVEEILTAILNHGLVSLAFVPYVEQFPLRQLKRKWNPSK